MFTRCAVLSLLIATTGICFGQQIHLKTRDIDTSVLTPTQTAHRNHISPASRVHLLVQFDHAPVAEDLDKLVRAGAEIVNAVPDNALVVSLAAGRSLPRNSATWSSELNPADKLSPALSKIPNEPIQALIEFHPDITTTEQNAVIAAAGLTATRPAVLLSNHAIVNATRAQLALLADDDSVAYIFPAGSDLTSDPNLMPCAGMLTTAGPVAQYANIVHGWDPEDGGVRLNYVFGALTPKQAATNVQSEIIRALNAWSQQVNIVFQPSANISAIRTIYIWFASGAHGDAYPFTNGVLAHTFYPAPINPESIAGDMHLNLDENWNIGGDIDIYSVALHEIGHAIGLGHSDNPDDVMYPYYRRGVALSANDIGAAVALYGAATPSQTSTAGSDTASGSGTPVGTTVGTTVNTGSTTPQPAAPLTLTLTMPPSSTQANTVSLSGAVTGGTGAVTVQWQTDQSFSGSATVVNGVWSASGIPLVTGTNNITVTAFDASHASASQTATVSVQPPSTTNATPSPISIRVTSPAAMVTSVNSTTVTVTGQAAGGSGGVTKVTWTTLAGASGTAAGTGTWVASGIPLLEGTNAIVLRAYDSTGANAWAALVVVRQ